MFVQDEMKVCSISPQREHSGPEEGDLAAKVRLSTTTNVDKLKGIFRSPEAFNICVESHYNEDGSLKVPEQQKVGLDVKGTGLKISMKSEFGDSIEFTENNKIDGIKYQLLDGHRCDLDLKVLVHPDGDQVSTLMGMLLNSVTFAAIMKDTVDDEVKEKQTILAIDTAQPTGSDETAGEPASTKVTPIKKERVKGQRQLPPSAHGDGGKPEVH